MKCPRKKKKGRDNFRSMFALEVEGRSFEAWIDKSICIKIPHIADIL